MFHTASEEEVLRGEVTDVYFTRVLEVLNKDKIDRRVKAEFVVKSFPEDYAWAILAGSEELLGLIEKRKLALDVRAIREGTLFHPNQPVMEIDGRYVDFCIFETAFL